MPSSVSLRTIPAVTAPPPTHRAAPAGQHRPLTPTRPHLTSVRDDNAKERGTSPLNTPSPQREAGDQNAGDRLPFLAGSERDTGWTGKPARQPENQASAVPAGGALVPSRCRTPVSTPLLPSQSPTVSQALSRQHSLYTRSAYNTSTETGLRCRQVLSLFYMSLGHLEETRVSEVFSWKMRALQRARHQGSAQEARVAMGTVVPVAGKEQ